MNEATVRASLQIVAGNLRYQSQPSGFSAIVTGRFGPTPGAITVTTQGVDVDLSELVTPGLCQLTNVDLTNYVEVGVYEPDNDRFYPLIELLPGECYTVRLSRNFGVEYEGTGTGTSAPTNRLRIKANTASVVVKVEAFER